MPVDNWAKLVITSKSSPLTIEIYNSVDQCEASRKAIEDGLEIVDPYSSVCIRGGFICHPPFDCAIVPMVLVTAHDVASMTIHVNPEFPHDAREIPKFALKPTVKQLIA